MDEGRHSSRARINRSHSGSEHASERLPTHTSLWRFALEIPAALTCPPQPHSASTAQTHPLSAMAAFAFGSNSKCLGQEGVFDFSALNTQEKSYKRRKGAGLQPTW